MSADKFFCAFGAFGAIAVSAVGALYGALYSDARAIPIVVISLWAGYSFAKEI